MKVQNHADGETAIHLANEFIRLTIRPDSSGRISSLQILPDGIELIPPLRETVNREPLLPDIVESNRIGFTDWLWGSYVGPKRSYQYEVLSQTSERCSVVLKGSAGRFAVERRLELLAGSMIVRQAITVTNPHDQTAELHYWAHLTLNGTLFFEPASRPSITYVPADTGGIRHKGRMLTPFDQPAVHRWVQEADQTFFQPWQPWFMRISETSNVAIAMRMAARDLQPDGVLYMWEGRSKTDGLLATMEILAGRRRLQPGQSAIFQVDLIGVTDIEPFVTLTESHVISKGPDATWRILALEDTPAQTATIHDRNNAYEITLPAMHGGQRITRPE